MESRRASRLTNSLLAAASKPTRLPPSLLRAYTLSTSTCSFRCNSATTLYHPSIFCILLESKVYSAKFLGDAIMRHQFHSSIPSFYSTTKRAPEVARSKAPAQPLRITAPRLGSITVWKMLETSPFGHTLTQSSLSSARTKANFVNFVDLVENISSTWVFPNKQRLTLFPERY